MSFGRKRGKQAAGSLRTRPEMDDLNQAPEISPGFVGEQAVTGGTRACAEDRGEWDIPAGDSPHVYLSRGHVRPAHSFLNSGGIAHTSRDNDLRCFLSTSKRPPRAPNNRRACYVRRYQHIMNVMDWLVSNPSKRLSLTDVPVNLASVCALSRRYCALSHLRNDFAEAGIRTADLAAALAKIRINRAMLRSH